MDADATPSFSTTQNLTFTTSDWNQPQTVTVKGADDSVQNAGGKRTVTISHTVTTGDGAGYPTSLSIDGVTVDVTDDDGQACTLTLPTDAVTVAEITGLRDKFPSDTARVLRWNQVLAAMGESTGETAMTAADAQTRSSVVGDRWDRVARTLAAHEACPGSTPPSTPSASFGSASYSGGEASGSRSVSVGVSLSSVAPSGGLSLTYSVRGSATSGSDYTALSGTVTVAGGSTSATVAVTITDDSVDDDAETIVLTLTSGSGYTLGAPKATTVTIADDDPAPRSDPNPGNTGNQNPGDTGNQNPGNSSPGNTNSGSSSSANAAPAAPPVVELTLGVATPSSIALGESSLMTVDLERAVTRWVRVFVEIDSTAVLGHDYTVDANWGIGWVSLGSNSRRLVFDLPPNDTDAVVRVNSLDASAPDSSVTLSVTIGDRTFAASSVVTIKPVGEAEIVSVGDPEASVSDGDPGDGSEDADESDESDGADDQDDDGGDDSESDGADGQDDDGDDDGDAGDGSDDADESDESDGADDQGGDGETAETEDSDEDNKAVDDDGHIVDPESLGTVTSTGDGWYVLYTVKPGDTLSGIALTFYRDDRRWRQIFAANQGRRQSDGYTFTSPNMIRAGWVLRVPLPIVAPSNATAAESNYVIYRVRSGDMLSSVGRRVYGDSAFYNRIVLANRGRRQANGQTFVHGDRIAAGWLLRIPVGG